MPTQSIPWGRHAMALVITAVIFTLGVLIGGELQERKLATLEELQQEIYLENWAMELQYQLLAEEPCSLEQNPLSERLYPLAQRLEFMEGQLGKEDTRVLDLKQYYTLLQIQHWRMAERLNKECNRNLTLIQYYYSNQKCDRCDQQGAILTALRRMDPNIRIYSYDLDLENPALRALKLRYNAISAPTLVVRGEVLVHYTTRTELEGLLYPRN